jgi:arylsulfatase A-like enzyme
MRPNILFIVVDTLRANSLGCYGYKRNTSPHIDQLAKQSILFEYAFCTINATDPSFTTIFSGRSPRSHSIHHHGDQISEDELNRFISKNVLLLPEILKKQGYRTFGLDWLGRWHRKGYDYYSGLHVNRVNRKKILKQAGEWLDKIGLYTTFKKIYHTPFLRPLIGKFDLYNEDEKLTKKAIDIIRSQHEPFFLFIHYWGIHAPYNCPKKYFQEFRHQPSSINIPHFNSFDFIKNERYRKFYEDWTKGRSFFDIITRYDGAIKHVDAQIGQLLTTLDKYGKRDNTIIIITSDHGESLVEHNIFFDHHGLYDTSIHVPLIISFPHMPAKRIKSLVQHMDILPTILSQVNIPLPDDIDGLDLTPIISGEKENARDYIIAEENHFQKKECIRTMKYKYIRSVGNALCSRCGIVHGNSIELYDVEQDPEERRNIIGSHDASKLIALLDDYKKKYDKQEEETERLNAIINEIDV